MLLLALGLIIELNRMLSCMRGGYLSSFVVAAVVCEVLWRVLSCMRGGYCSVLLLVLWIIIELNRMFSCMRGGHLSDVIVVAVVGVNEKLRERWLPVWCCCCGW